MDSLVLLSSLMLAACGGTQPAQTPGAASAVPTVVSAEEAVCPAVAEPAAVFEGPRAASATATTVYDTCATNCGFTTCLYGGCCGSPCKGTRMGLIKRCDNWDPRGGCLSGWYCVNQMCSTGFCCS